MNFNSPIPRAKQPDFHQGSALRSVRDSDNVDKQWLKTKDLAKAINSIAQAAEQTQKQVNKMQRRMLGAVHPIYAWHKPENGLFEVNADWNYSEGSVIHIQSTNGLVITGIHDRANPSGSMKQSCPGLWVAMQDVPAQVTISGVLQWNLPQWPLPVPTNYDDPANYWLYLGDIADC